MWFDARAGRSISGLLGGDGTRRRRASATRCRSRTAFSADIGRPQGVGTSKRTMTVGVHLRRRPILPTRDLGFNVNEIDFVVFYNWRCGEIPSRCRQDDRLHSATSTWYHVLIQIDTPQATAANRVKIFVDAVDMTDTAGSVYRAKLTTPVGTTRRFEYHPSMWAR
jgi:hypothetical protein